MIQSEGFALFWTYAPATGLTTALAVGDFVDLENESLYFQAVDEVGYDCDDLATSFQYTITANLPVTGPSVTEEVIFTEDGDTTGDEPEVQSSGLDVSAVYSANLMHRRRK